MTDSDDVRGDDSRRAVCQADRDRMLEAMHALEETVGRPAAGHSEAWTESVRASSEQAMRTRSA
jgi:hypothetical protein